MESCARATGNDAFGAELSQAQASHSRGLFHYIIVNCPTLRAALEARVRFIELFSNAYSTTFEPLGSDMAFEWIFPPPNDQMTQIAGYIAGTALAKIRLVLEPEWHPLAMEFTHPVPNSQTVFTRIFGPSVRYGAAKNRMIFDAASLDRRLQRADSHLLREVEAFGRRLLGLPTGGDGIVEKVRDQIIMQMGNAEAASEITIARALHMPVRALQRRLAERGTSFRALFEEARKAVATHLITETELPLTEVARIVGYSELSAFSRAARIWFGTSPSQMRSDTMRGRR